MTDEEAALVARRARMLDDLRAFIIQATRLKRAVDEIDPDTALFGSGLGLDSVDAVDLVAGVEARYRVKMPRGPQMVRALRTVNTLLDTVLEGGSDGPA